MYELDLLSLFLLGLFGSAHCIGMCGPLVLAIPSGSSRLLSQLTYNLGRIVTYTLVGMTLGGLGSGLSTLSGKSPMVLLHRVEIVVSFVSALLLLSLGLARLAIWREPAWMQGIGLQRLPGFARVQRQVVADRTPSAVFGFGLLLGLLPCGLSYGAFAVSLAAGGAVRGGLMTLAFGLGTVPGLLALGTAATAVVRRHRRLFELLAGLLMIVMAVTIAVRGISRL